MTRYHDKLATKVPGVGKRWEEEWKPEVRARNEAERTADYDGAERRRSWWPSSTS